ncbi:MAG TPA: bacteriohopanetetrol glucosamine biosynthesis glycosyltransferase HpnI [Candidatus Acidoferrum sp.]|nr:bacteriohopanetetrol glucosamine biosynthesis glycosyltransferase HpnI [Candidatus Acidoferrum sp.]
MPFERLLAAALTFVTLAAIAYTVIATVCIARFGREPESRANDLAPPVSLLVPLHGAEFDLEANLLAFAQQDYPEFQLVLGVARSDDPALPIARRVAAALPDRNIDIDLGEAAGSRNPKIANVLSMMRLVRHKVLIMADSDTRVTPNYIRSVTAPLRDPSIGVVTCPFAGVPDGTFSSKLGAMFMNEQFIPSVLVNRLLGFPQHCLGPTNAFRAEVLAEIGGFEALAPHLADDYMLGNFVAAAGMRVVISRHVIHTIVSDSTLAVLWDHELRWHRTIRGVQPAGYAGMFLTYPLPLALLAFLLAPQFGSAVVVVIAAIARIVLQRVSARALGVPPASVWLILPRDLFGIALWACGLAGRAVRWRGTELHMESGDVLAERSQL